MEKSKNQKLLSRNTELEEILAVSGKNEMCMCKMFGFQMVTVHASNFFLRVALTGPRPCSRLHSWSPWPTICYSPNTYPGMAIFPPIHALRQLFFPLTLENFEEGSRNIKYLKYSIFQNQPHTSVVDLRVTCVKYGLEHF